MTILMNIYRFTHMLCFYLGVRLEQVLYWINYRIYKGIQIAANSEPQFLKLMQ